MPVDFRRETIERTKGADLVRILLGLLLTVISIRHGAPVFILLSSITAVYAILWFFLCRFTNLAIRYNWIWYVSPFSDFLGISVGMLLLGNINSIMPLIMVLTASMGAINPTTKKWIVLSCLGVVSFNLIGILSYAGVLPKVNVLGAGYESSLTSLIMYCCVVDLLVILIPLIVRKSSMRNASLIVENENSRAKGERLLLNILPRAVIDELERTGRVVPRRVDSATMLFSDFVSFTSSTARLDPISVIGALGEYFSAFDEIMERHGIDKIKTLGDGYMGAGGVTKIMPAHPIEACLAALEMLAFARERSLGKRLGWDIRIGIHSGSVIAGIIGKDRFSFDIWGDAVNIASRHESSGVANAINVSMATYYLVRDFFDFEERGDIEIKGGEQLRMYLLKGIKSEYRDSANGGAGPRLIEIIARVNSGEYLLGMDSP